MPYLLTLLIHLQGHPLVDKDQFNENVKLTINMKVQFISSIISLKFKFATDGKGRNKTPGDKVSEDWTSLEYLVDAVARAAWTKKNQMQ